MILPTGYSNEARALWDAATALNRAASAVSPAAAALPPLLFFTDPERTPRPWETAARLPAGSAVVFRAFGATDAAAAGRKLRKATAGAGVRLLVGLDAELAEDIGADGVHLPERAADQSGAIRLRRPDWIITLAWHGAAKTREDAADALVLSPVFPAGGASARRKALGVATFQGLVEKAARPVYALGGVRPENAAELIGSGACGLAGVEAIRSAYD